MIILVTGGLGFIGSHLIKYLSSNRSGEAYRIYNIDNLSIGSNVKNLCNKELHNESYRLVIGDIADICKLNIDKPEVIINVAAETHVDRSISDPLPFIHSNYEGTFKLLEYSRKNDVKKFIQISTDEVYGECHPQYSFSETDRLSPSNPYSASKAAADLLVGSYCRTYGLNACITRCTNNFGPNQFPEKLIPKTIIRILRRQPIVLYGDGKQEREWIYVEDHVRAIDRVLDKGRPNETYNISTSNLVSNIELVQRINNIIGKQTGKHSTINLVEDRPGHDRRYSLDWRKIKEELQWKPIVDFDHALNYTIRWYINNEGWWTIP